MFLGHLYTVKAALIGFVSAPNSDPVPHKSHIYVISDPSQPLSSEVTLM